MDLGEWLRSLGLERYEAAFRDNEINERVLQSLTTEDLKDLGVSIVGHRRLLLDAVAALRAEANTKARPASPATEGLPAPATSTAPVAQATAERRQVTVMFSDLVGSTALADRMDPEDLREVISGYQKCVTETVNRCGGFVAKYMGDGVLVYFGYPQAHEDDAERAVRAGLAVIEAVRQAGRAATAQGAARPRHRPRRRRRSDRRGRGAGVGHCRRDAEPCGAASGACGTKYPRRLRRHAAANRRALRDGGSRPAAARRLRCAATRLARNGRERSLSRFEALRAAFLTPLVGREEEIALLLRRWRWAAAGEGHVVLISGEPGIGKSRLIDALRERLEGEELTRLRYFTSPHHQDSALYPFIAQLNAPPGSNATIPSN